jgi:hypothetical protein
MKPTSTLFIAITMFTVMSLQRQADAQVPEKISYQAVIRNSNNELVTSSTISMVISILQGSASGSPIYIETHTPTTNANGLITIEIGGGTIVSGLFNTIDWANDLYFIKIETDPSGGMNYTIAGTSQILSVPYALHAKTAETITGEITETDPLWTAASANYYTKTDMQTSGSALLHFGNLANKPTTLSGYGITDFDFTGAAANDLLQFNGNKWVKFTPNFALTTHTHANATSSVSGFMSGTDKNKLDDLQNADGSETKVTAGTDITITGSGTTGSPYVISAGSSLTHTIGESYGGGKIFYLTPDGQHGLIAAAQDQPNSTWFSAQNSISYASNHNTAGQNYTDWRLPTLHELQQLESVKTLIGGFLGGYYWSSTEYDTENAWWVYLVNGVSGHQAKNGALYIRAVRSF